MWPYTCDEVLDDGVRPWGVNVAVSLSRLCHCLFKRGLPFLLWARSALSKRLFTFMKFFFKITCAKRNVVLILYGTVYNTKFFLPNIDTVWRMIIWKHCCSWQWQSHLNIIVCFLHILRDCINTTFSYLVLGIISTIVRVVACSAKKDIVLFLRVHVRFPAKWVKFFFSNFQIFVQFRVCSLLILIFCLFTVTSAPYHCGIQYQVGSNPRREICLNILDFF
jgi:hypothetical protein